MVLHPVVSIGEIHAMDSLLTYESSSSSNSDGEAWTKTQPPWKKRSIKQMSALVTLEGDALMDRPASDPGRKRNPYAPNIGDLSPRMRAFLASVKTYFMQRVNLERQKATLCPSTYNKAQERVLSTYMLLYVFYSVRAQRPHTHV